MPSQPPPASTRLSRLVDDAGGGLGGRPRRVTIAEICATRKSRPAASPDPPLDNPFHVQDHSRDEALEVFRCYLHEHPELVAPARRELTGRDLACCCQPG
ncbi:DUF4326 domain-containing protein [Nonomuraea typhae]|uniref:DUF4326 domain-containing protein n=1 Tax=Nonomuraea typhae TaxID=2603600 RepID=UPI001C6746F4